MKKVIKVAQELKAGRVEIRVGKDGWGRLYENGKKTAGSLTPIQVIMLKRLFA